MTPLKLDPPLVLTPGPDNPVRLVISRNKLEEAVRIELDRQLAEGSPYSRDTDRGKLADAIIRAGAKPEEVTPEMIQAGFDAAVADPNHREGINGDQIEAIYRAMRAAAR